MLPACVGADPVTGPVGIESSLPSTSTAVPGTTVTASTVGPTGPLRVLLAQPPEPNLDPIRWSEPELQRQYRLAYESLYTWDADGSLVPQLAAEPPDVSRDRLVYTVRVKPGVAFHDGPTMTAVDVAESWRRVLDVANVSQWSARVLPFLESVKEFGEDAVSFRLFRPYTPFAGLLGRIPIIAARPEYRPQETHARTTNGTGPFRLVEWQPEGTLRWERFDGYHLGTPPIEAIEFSIVTSEPDLVPDLPLDQLDRFAGMEVQVAEQSTNRVFVYPNLDPARPTSHYGFRRAIALAFDRGALIEAIGSVGVPSSTCLSDGSEWFSVEVGERFGRDPDPEQAQILVDEVWGDPDTPLTLAVLSSPVNDRAAELLRTGLARIGVLLDVVAETAAEVAGRFAVGDPGSFGNFDLALVNSFVQPTSGFGPEYCYLGYRSGLFTNLNKVADPDLDTLLDAAVAAPPGPEAQRAWRAIQIYDLEQGLYQIPLVTTRYVEAASPRLSGYTVSALGSLESLRVAQLAS